MKKYLIYMGRIGNLHRIALFDADNILARSLSVKDVAVLPENVEYMNCTVKDGVVTPNLKGAKIMCAVPKNVTPQFKRDTQEERRKHTYNERAINPELLWVDKNKKPEYLYGITETTNDLSKPQLFNPGALLRGGIGWSVWDGTCTEQTFYVIAMVATRNNSKRNKALHCFLCLTSTGELFYTFDRDMGICLNSGATFVQVGTPDLTVPNVYAGSRLFTGKVPLLQLKDEDVDKIIWPGRNKIEGLESTAETVWWNPSYRMTVCDFRNYTQARAFGINSICDATMIVFPDTAEDIWLGLFQSCPSLKSVYIPQNVRHLRDYGVPLRRIKSITVYSSSPLAAEFCAKYGAQLVDCTNVTEMLDNFYSASDTDYISVSDANSIAALGGSESDKNGESGTIWSAALFSIASEGMASATLQERFPVVDTCNGSYRIPTSNITKMGVGSGSCAGHGQYGKDRTRAMAAALTQFYPFCATEYAVDYNDVVYDKYELGDYSLYIATNALNKEKFYARTKVFPPQQYYGTAARKARKDEVGDVYAHNNIALLADSRNEVIHRFSCGHVLRASLMCLEGAALSDTVPCGVLRYADKLPVLYNWYYGSDEHKNVVEALFKTFMVFLYGTKLAKRQLVGIDLHTGALATADYTTNSYNGFGYSNPQPASYFVGVNRLSNIKLHPMDADLSSLFPKDCEYNKGK